ncbi:CapA family protein [Erythrobacter arachoides]|uniref:CapA family protein n=1 Tax=Aurantiacibacter arachoides TaxID=1850444 RepID=A0A845A2W6_9SPHN|nr:CapA family protein [Aurantiacibacter arachoides]MXO94044.1 CapA family protein [Aurantiacibacter arachoides]
MNDDIQIAVLGDLVLDEPDADHWLSGIAPAIRAADLGIAHLEVPHTTSAHEMAGDVPAPGAPPENIAAIARAGIGMVSLAGNHIADCGAQGIADTVALLDAAGIAHAGAGADLAAARAPAFADVGGRRVALLSYNCVGPEMAWAAPGRAGCAYLPIVAADGAAVSPKACLERVHPDALETLLDDIAAARAGADCVLVAMHKGQVHTPAMLQPYEREIARAAIDAGADAVLSHHAHIVRGIEFHRGKPIYHGLGNGCVVTSALSPTQDHEGRRAWAEQRQRMFGFTPDPAYPLAPFHPEAVNAFIGMLTLRADGSVGAAIVPVDVEPPGRPVLAAGERARAIARYVEGITTAADLPAVRIADDFTVEIAA